MRGLARTLVGSGGGSVVPETLPGMVSGDQSTTIANPGGPARRPQVPRPTTGPRARRTYCRSRRMARSAPLSLRTSRPYRDIRRPPASTGGASALARAHPGMVRRPCRCRPSAPPAHHRPLPPCAPSRPPSAPSRSPSPRSWPSPRCSRSCPATTAGAVGSVSGPRARTSASPSAAASGARPRTSSTHRSAAVDGAGSAATTTSFTPVVIPEDVDTRGRGPRCPAPRPATSSTTAPSSPATRPRPTVEDGAGPDPALQGQVRRHPGHHRQQVRRVDDDPVVGQQAQVQGRPAHRPGAPRSRPCPASS